MLCQIPPAQIVQIVDVGLKYEIVDKVTKYAAAFLGVVALIALAAGGGFYFFIQQKNKKQAEKEAIDPDADYTEDKGDFEIPPEDDSDEDTSEEQDVTPI